MQRASVQRASVKRQPERQDKMGVIYLRGAAPRCVADSHIVRS